MKTMTLHKLAFGFDRTRNALVFQLMLEDGTQCEVVFPIGHVAVMFDNEAAALGYNGRPMMGYVETVDGFLGYVEMVGGAPELGWFGSKLVKSVSKAVSSVGKVAFNQTIGKVAKQAVAVARAGVNIAKGQNVVKSLGGVVKASTGDLKLVAQYAGTVPGIGTAVGALASGANAALNGKSLTEIAKATAIGAIPGGPLAQAVVSAAVNVAQAGIEGKNLVKSAAGELVNAAVSMAPGPTQATIRAAAMAVINGQNVLTATQRSVIQTAINQIPDASARAVLQNIASGNVSPTLLIQAAGGQLAGKVISKTPNGALSRLVNHAATLAPATPHFPAISAQGLAAAAAGHVVSKLATAAPTPANVQALARVKSNLLAVSRTPQGSLIAAGLQQARLRAA